LLNALADVTPIVAIERNGRRVFVSTRDRSEILRSVIDCGTYEPRLVAAAVRILVREGLLGKSEQVLVDVGANIGVSTIEILAQHAYLRGIAIEPDLHNFELLQHNLLAAGLWNKVQTIQAAASDKDGVGSLAVAPKNLGDHRLISPDTQAGVPVDRAQQKVRVLQLDTLIDELGVSPADCALVWVDTQGHEPYVLAGSRRIMAAGAAFVCEYWPAGMAAGGVLARFDELVCGNFQRVVDLEDPDSVLEPAAVGMIADRLRARRRQYTNLLLLPNKPRTR
jgi:FkbM family methyltransferase